MVEQQPAMQAEGEDQLMQELRRLEQSARNYQQEVSFFDCFEELWEIYTDGLTCIYSLSHRFGSEIELLQFLWLRPFLSKPLSCFQNDDAEAHLRLQNQSPEYRN